MERPNTIHGLKAKRDELQRELEAAEKAVRAIRVDIDHVEATLRLFTDDAPRAIPRHTVQHRAKKGEMQRHVVSMLRKAGVPLTSQDIATAYLEARGLDASHETHVLIRKRVGACLNALKHKGRVETVPLAGQFAGWRKISFLPGGTGGYEGPILGIFLERHQEGLDDIDSSAYRDRT